MQQNTLDRLYVDLSTDSGRNISATVLVSKLELPTIEKSRMTEWINVLLEENPLASPGDVLTTQTPPPKDIAELLHGWSLSQGFDPKESDHNPRLLACEGSLFHHDLDFRDYREAAFSILWLEDETPWDLVFPLIGLRIPLERGTHVMFDSANLHGVVSRGADSFVEEDFYEPGFQMFFSTEHPYSCQVVREKMAVEFQKKPHWSSRTSMQAACADIRYFDPLTGALRLP